MRLTLCPALALTALAVATTTARADQLMRWTERDIRDVRLEQDAGPVLGKIRRGTVFSSWRRDGDHLLVSLKGGETGWLKVPYRERRALELRLKRPGKFERREVEPQVHVVVPRAVHVEYTRPLSAVQLVISLQGLTCHVIAPTLGIDEVLPVGVGVKNGVGKSVTPTCRSLGVASFFTHRDPEDAAYYARHRWEPGYYGGHPFIRLDIPDDDGYHSFGLCGPVTRDESRRWQLRRGYVSNGSIRFLPRDLEWLFEVLSEHPNSRVVIQEEIERRDDGSFVVIDHPFWP